MPSKDRIVFSGILIISIESLLFLLNTETALTIIGLTILALIIALSLKNPGSGAGKRPRYPDRN